MDTILLTLHLWLRAVPYDIELTLAALLGASWLLARTRIEYNAQIQQTSQAAFLVVSICGFIGWLFVASMLIDCIVFQNYTRLPLFGTLLALLLIGAGVCQTLGQRAARRQLEKHGYERGYLPILPKQRS